MSVIGLAILGVILGAAGIEFLRASKPELLEKVENGVKHVVDFTRPSRTAGKKTKQ